MSEGAEQSDQGGVEDDCPGEIARHYDAWQDKRDDLREVPLAEDFRFTGPVANFTGHALTGFVTIEGHSLGSKAFEHLDVMDGAFVVTVLSRRVSGRGAFDDLLEPP